MKRIQRGYTLVELLVSLWGLFCIGLIGAIIWVIFHFIAKFW